MDFAKFNFKSFKMNRLEKPAFEIFEFKDENDPTVFATLNEIISRKGEFEILIVRKSAFLEEILEYINPGEVKLLA